MHSQKLPLATRTRVLATVLWRTEYSKSLYFKLYDSAPDELLPEITKAHLRWGTRYNLRCIPDLKRHERFKTEAGQEALRLAAARLMGDIKAEEHPGPNGAIVTRMVEIDGEMMQATDFLADLVEQLSRGQGK